MLESGRGRLADKFSYVKGHERHQFRLVPGKGLLLYMEVDFPNKLFCPGDDYTKVLHAVVLYRGLDGEYCFFDSNSLFVPTFEVLAAVMRSGMAAVHYSQERYGVQGRNIQSCQYHCLAFMSFVVQHRKMPTASLHREFVSTMRPQGDLKAVLISQEIYDEAGFIIDFESGPTPFIQNSSSEDGGRRKRGRKRPLESQRVVSQYLRGLSRQQVQTLLQAVTVTPVKRART